MADGMVAQTAVGRGVGTLPPPPTAARLGVVLLSAAVGLSAFGGAWLALTGLGTPVWGFFGFEIVTLVASAIGVLAGMGRFRDGWGLAVLCIGGTVFVAGVLGMWLDAQKTFGNAQQLGLRDIARVGAMARVGAGAALMALAGAAVLSRDRRAWIDIAMAAGFGLPVVAVLGWLWRGGMASLSRPGSAGVLVSVGAIAVGFVLCVLASISGHLAIRAFSRGRAADEE